LSASTTPFRSRIKPRLGGIGSVRMLLPSDWLA